MEQQKPSTRASKQCCSRDHNRDGNCDRHRPKREEPEFKIINLQREPEDKLLPCPFCGRNDMVLENTHSPCYWIECQCGAQMHGPGVKWKGPSGQHSMANHKKAKAWAIELWNRRAAVGRPRPRFLYGKSAV